MALPFGTACHLPALGAGMLVTMITLAALHTGRIWRRMLCSARDRTGSNAGPQ
ncbi:hypothetical protein BH24CHL6_BH24CHL6_14270 [soil metagenome]